MKNKLNNQVVAAFGLLFTCILQPTTLLAQGSLTPPGAPAPTMKTLQQVEPRVPISSAPFTITEPGSYYLTTNLTVSGGDAITIATSGVTLDLNGFTISSTANPASGTAILLSDALKNVAILNGHIQGSVTNDGSGNFNGPGFGYGISYSGLAPQNMRVSGVSVSGCRFSAINVDYFWGSTTVENCVVMTVGNYGIVASTIRGCLASDCGNTAIIGYQVSDSRGEAVVNGLSAHTAQNCYGGSSDNIGLTAANAHNCYGENSNYIGLSAGTAQNCYGYSSTGYGLYATTAQNCYGRSISEIGLRAFTAQNCYGASSSGTGLYADSTAIGCHGYSNSGSRGLYAQNANTCTGYRPGGLAIEATIANGCWAASGTNLITFKYNMP
jgi:hypothetical protein